MRVAMERVVAEGKPLTFAAMRDELRKAGFMTDQERRAGLEKLLAMIRAGTRSHVNQTQSATASPANKENPVPLPEATSLQHPRSSP
jgi:hypothetical protein